MLPIMAEAPSPVKSDGKGIKVMFAFGLLLFVLPLLVYWVWKDTEAEKSREKPVKLEKLEATEQTTETVSIESVMSQRPRSPDLAWVVEAHLEAMGGRERLLAVNTVIVDCELYQNGLATEVVVMGKRPRFIFQKARPEGGEAKFWSDGVSIWREIFRNGRVEQTQLAGQELERFQFSLDFDSPIVRHALSSEYPDRIAFMELEGEGKHAGQSGYWLRVEDDLGVKRGIFINSETLLMDYERVYSGDNQIHFSYDDYRKVDGLMKPFRQDIENRNSGLRSVMKVSSYRFNTFMYTALFSPPFAEDK